MLTRPDAHEGKAAISVQYVGVSAESRRRGIFSTLMEKLKANGVPLLASVLHDNRSAMTDKLEKIGFTKTGSDAKQTTLLWSPAV